MVAVWIGRCGVGSVAGNPLDLTETDQARNGAVTQPGAAPFGFKGAVFLLSLWHRPSDLPAAGWFEPILTLRTMVLDNQQIHETTDS